MLETSRHKWRHISLMTLRNIGVLQKQDVTETKKVWYQTIPFVLTKKMHRHTWSFYSHTKKLQVSEVLKGDSRVTKEIMEKAEVIQKLIFFSI